MARFGRHSPVVLVVIILFPMKIAIPYCRSCSSSSSMSPSTASRPLSPDALGLPGALLFPDHTSSSLDHSFSSSPPPPSCSDTLQAPVPPPCWHPSMSHHVVHALSVPVCIGLLIDASNDAMTPNYPMAPLDNLPAIRKQPRMAGTCHFWKRSTFGPTFYLL